MHTKGDFPLNDCGLPWPRPPRRCDSTMKTVLLAYGVVRPSRASEHMNALWAKRKLMAILEVYLCQTGREGGSTL